jgi:hypothetical protein
MTTLIIFKVNLKQLLRGLGVHEDTQKPDKRLHQRGKNLTKLFFLDKMKGGG